MAKPKKRARSIRPKISLALAAAALVAVALMLIFMPQAKAPDISGVHTSLGPLEYEIIDGEATKRTDPQAAHLRQFLKTQAQKELEAGCKTAHYNVKAANKDETQVLLHYGCDYPSGHMFAVNKGGKWEAISPTNQFDQFGLPTCSHADQHNISSAIAPVCVRAPDSEQSEYRVR